MTSQWRKYLTEAGHLRVVAIEATALLHELCAQQNLTGPAQQGYAEAVVGALLIASGHKSNESINLNAQGTGRWRQAIIDATPDGQVRGFLNENDEIQSAGNWGTGVLSILFTQHFEGKTPYTGVVALSSDNLDESINAYFRESAQLSSHVGLHVIWENGRIVCARGAMVQALGGASAEELQALAELTLEDLREMASQTDDWTAFELQTRVALGHRPLIAVETTELKSFCTCSEERIERALLLTGEAATLEALADDDFMSITCDFCRKPYRLAATRVRALFKRDPSSRLQ